MTKRDDSFSTMYWDLLRKAESKATRENPADLISEVTARNDDMPEPPPDPLTSEVSPASVDIERVLMAESKASRDNPADLISEVATKNDDTPEPPSDPLTSEVSFASVDIEKVLMDPSIASISVVPIPSQARGPEVTTVHVAIKVLVTVSYILAWVCILFVPFWKIIDTSFLFRERDDPSMFDNVTDYFSDSAWPWAKFIDSGKDTYRVYFFIMPFFLGFLFLAVKGFLGQKYGQQVSVPQLPALMHYRFAFGLSVLDLSLISATLIYSAILLWARQKRSLTRGARKLTFLYVDSKEPIDPLSWGAAEVMAKTLGVLTITLLGWFVLMPISRRSVLLDLFGVPREVAVKYHRWLGWYTLWALLAHTFVYIAVWAHANGHPDYNPEGDLLRHMMLAGSCNNGDCDPDTEVLHTEMMYGFASLAIMLVMCAAAVNYIRRRYYEVFYYAHQLFILMILFLAFHYNKTPLYLLPGIVMFLVDKTIGLLACIGTVAASTKTLSNDMFELKVRKDRRVNCEAGQYVFVNVPAVSVLQWHPITVTWSTDEEVVLHIRARGNQTWTQQVYNHVMFRKGGSIKVNLDGFYGKDLVTTYSLSKKEAVVFACGGCGLTFPFSIIEKLCLQNATLPVHLHWVTRTKQEYAAFQELLQDSTSRFRNLSVSVWVTLKGHSEYQKGHYCKASTPTDSVLPEQAPRESARRFGYLWRPYPTWLWSAPGHACVTAFAILMGVSGYAVARHQEFSSKMNETREMILERLLGLVLTVVFAFALLAVLIGPRLLPIVISACVDHGNKLRKGDGSFTETGRSSSSSSSGHDDVSRYDLDTIELGNAPHVQGTGRRPDYEEIFGGLEQAHDRNVAVFACGPQGLVDDVRRETQKRVKKNWCMIEEEWEW